MTVTLGDILLSDELVLTGLETAPDVVTSQKRTLTGVSIVTAAPVVGGRTLTLSGQNHYTLGQIQAVKALAALAQPVILSHHRGTFSVLIIGTPVEPAIDYSNPTADDWYSGDITLLEV